MPDYGISWDDDNWINIGDGLELPAEITSVSPWEGYDVTLNIAYIAPRYRCVRLEMKLLAETGPPDRVLSPLPVPDFVYRAVWPLVRQALEILPRDIESESPDQRARHASVVYRASEVAGLPPRKMVSEVFGVSTSTAARLIGTARKEGYLARTDNPGGRPRKRHVG